MSGVLLTIVLFLGVWSTWYLGNKVEIDERNSLLLRTQTIAAMIEQSDLKELRGDESDLTHPPYLKIKEIMERVHSINKDARFVYIMGIRDNQQFFYVDSENPSSPDYSHPGQIYADASAQDIENHLNGVTYTKGPYTDAWGRWFTAYAPVLDENNTVLGLVGMDTEAEHLLLRISIVRKATAIISGLVFLCAFTLILLGKKSIKHTAEC